MTEFWIVIVILLVSAIFNWLKKKAEGQQDEWSEVEQPPPRRGGPPPVIHEGERKSFDWQEELRRMLEGERTEQPAPRQPPPLVRQEPARTPPPPQFQVVIPPPAPPVVPKPVKQTTLAGIQRQIEPVVPVVSLEPANVVYERPRFPVGRRPSHRRSPEIERALLLLRTPHAARQAIIVSAVLGTPKGLQP